MEISGGVSHRNAGQKMLRPSGAPTTMPPMPSTHLSLHYHLIFSGIPRSPATQRGGYDERCLWLNELRCPAGAAS